MKIEFTSQVFKEGRMFVAHTPELDISSCATTKTKALENLQEAVRLFLEEAERRGSLHFLNHPVAAFPGLTVESE
jgi:predicted RNase H-like HicB family nuclease